MTGTGKRVGRVVSVGGSTVKAVLDSGEDTTLQIGDLVKVDTGSSLVFGLVNNLYIDDPAIELTATDAKERHRADVELLGEATKTNGSDEIDPFERGVSIYPGLGSTLCTTTREELAWVYARPTEPNVGIGTVHQDRSLPAYVVTNDLLGKHFAVLGTTGAGKSCTVTLLLQSILQENPQGHIVLLDPHNEYGVAFNGRANVLHLGNLELPYWLLNFEEILEVLGSDGIERDAEAAILKEVIVEAKIRFLGPKGEDEAITVDTPTPYRLGDLSRLLDEGMGRLDKPEKSAPYQRIKARLEALRTDPRYAFMFPGLVVRDNMDEILSNILRIPVADKPVSVVDLSGVPSEVLDVVVSVLARMLFDFCLWAKNEEAMPILLVCEEAHRYAPAEEAAGFGPTKKAVARIAKEGRKYGVSLALVSQRPSELAMNVLSQCNTIFALRMSNNRDQMFVRGALPESAMGLLDALPSLRNQECIAVGEGVPVPVRLRFNDLPPENRPRSGTAPYSEAWNGDGGQSAFVEETVWRWRRQYREA